MSLRRRWRSGLFGALLVLQTGCGSTPDSGARGDVDVAPGLPGAAVAPQVPVLLAPGMVNTGLLTRDATMTPDGREFYWCQATTGYGRAVIVESRFQDGGWTEPRISSFSGGTGHIDIEPFVAPDGSRLFFVSTRPLPGSETGNADIWVCDRLGDGWGDPRPLGSPVNTENAEYFPAITLDGTLYFTRAEPDGRIHYIYRSRWDSGNFTEPERLPDAVNIGTNRFNATIIPDESRMILSAVGVEGSLGAVDYFMIRRDTLDRWSEPINLGPEINDGSVGGWSSYLTPDGQTLLFMSARAAAGTETWPRTWSGMQADHVRPGGGGGGIYAVDASILNDPETQVGRGSATTEPLPEAEPESPVTTWPGADLDGPYLGQALPGLEPEIFAPGLVSTGLNERDVLLAPDGRTLWFGVMAQGLVTVMETRRTDEGWSEPVTASFHGAPNEFCFEPAFTSDGETLLMLMNRATPGQEQGARWDNQNLYFIHRHKDGWSEPRPVGSPVTTAQAEYFPSIADDGSLYFTREDTAGTPAIYRAEPAGSEPDPVFAEPRKLGPQVNFEQGSFNATVAPDESWLIFCVAGHPENLGNTDFWIARTDGSGGWDTAINMGPRFNGPGQRAASASLSPDGTILFFSTNRVLGDENGRLTWESLVQGHASPGGGSLDVWWVDSRVLE